jgi:hypothetical protein
MVKFDRAIGIAALLTALCRSGMRIAAEEESMEPGNEHILFKLESGDV